MDFDWTTFILEIINFLILIWILKRFLYQPVLNIIDKRRAGIDAALAEAKRTEEEAIALKQKNEQFLVDWENEKEKKHAELAAELAQIREQKLTEIDNKINEEWQRRQILEERRQIGYERKVEEKAITQGTAFVSKLLSRLASPALENQLLTLLLEDLNQLSDEDKQAIINDATTSPALQITIQSAFPLSDEQHEKLRSALADITKTKLPIEFQCNDALLAGLQITIGSWVLHANLRDELKFFSKPLSHEK